MTGELCTSRSLDGLEVNNRVNMGNQLLYGAGDHTA